MGRLKYKVLFCTFCLERDPDQVINEHSFNQSVDVSHLAMPHVASNSSLRLSSNSTPVGDCNSEEGSGRGGGKHLPAQASLLLNNNNNSEPSHYHLPEPLDRIDPSSDRTNNSSNSQQHLNHSPSPVPSPPINNIYELQPSQEQQQQLQQQVSPPQPSPRNDNNIGPSPVAIQHHNILNERPPDQQNGTTAKLSYDIISVREPLAKILAEKHQIQLAQLQQRQILGDHDYIEVYGERGSSCFYEEIAGSTTSSATYDQIGAISNHNYQVLINAYAVANRPNISQAGEENNSDNNNNNHNNFPTNGLNSNQNDENVYDLTSHPTDQLDGRLISHKPTPSTSFAPPPPHSVYLPSTSHPPIPTDRTSILSQSIPVYSVINKANRRSNAIIRATISSCRPPQPPPKNPPLNHQASTSAIQSHHHSDSSTATSSNNQTGIKLSSPQIPSTSSYQNHGVNGSNEPREPHNKARLPQPPPRYKLHTYNAAKRPLPLPDGFEGLDNGDGTVIDSRAMQDEDVESINNGYELLGTNFDDDQIDVGYERIRESNRYSGGSLSSQFCPLQAIDNGGYESVQPIYSSPSNALAEPNYEAIGPTTASELAAAAAARLTAAATVYGQFLKPEK